MATSGWTPEEAALARGEGPKKKDEPEREEAVAGPEDDQEAPDDDSGTRVAADDEEAEPPSIEELQERASKATKARDEERNRRKASERAAKEAEQKLNLASAHMQAMWEQQRLQAQQLQLQQQQEYARAQQAAAQRPPPPTVDTDPAGYLNAIGQNQAQLVRNQQAIAAEMQRRAAQEQQVQQLEQAKQQVNAHFAQDIERAAEEIPDIREGVSYLYQQRMNELRVQGYAQPEAQQIVDRDYYQAVWEWGQKGFSPAEAFYEIARQRGYQPAAKNGNGGLERIQRGQDVTRSLSGVGGSAGRTGRMDAETVARMSPKQFEEWLDKHGADGFKEVMTRGRA
jgi:hypothetical protein